MQLCAVKRGWLNCSLSQAAIDMCALVDGGSGGGDDKYS